MCSVTCSFLACLQDAEDNLELEEKKVLSIQLERGKYKQEVDRRMAEKDIEAEADRKNLQRQLEEVQSTLENEMKAKSSLIRQRKSVEEQVAELEERISAGEKDYQELAKNNKKLSAHLKVPIYFTSVQHKPHLALRLLSH